MEGDNIQLKINIPNIVITLSCKYLELSIMLYTVKCTYTDPETEASWNNFYSQIKLPNLISINSFITSQRFKSLTSGCPFYLTIHTVTDVKAIYSEEYIQKGDGNFSYWQSNISEWGCNLYACDKMAPDVSMQEFLVICPKCVEFIEMELGFQPWIMQSTGLDRFSENQVAYVVPKEDSSLFSAISGCFFINLLQTNYRI